MTVAPPLLKIEPCKTNVNPRSKCLMLIKRNKGLQGGWTVHPDTIGVYITSLMLSVSIVRSGIGEQSWEKIPTELNSHYVTLPMTKRWEQQIKPTWWPQVRVSFLRGWSRCLRLLQAVVAQEPTQSGQLVAPQSEGRSYICAIQYTDAEWEKYSKEDDIQTADRLTNKSIQECVAFNILSTYLSRKRFWSLCSNSDKKSSNSAGDGGSNKRLRTGLDDFCMTLAPLLMGSRDSHGATSLGFVSCCGGGVLGLLPHVGEWKSSSESSSNCSACGCPWAFSWWCWLHPETT